MIQNRIKLDRCSPGREKQNKTKHLDVKAIGEGYIPQVSLRKTRCDVIKKSLLFEVFRALVSLMLIFPNLASV